MSFLGWLYAIAAIGVFGAPEKVLVATASVWGYLLLAAAAAISSKASSVNNLMLSAHFLLMTGAFAWGMKPETLWLGALVILGAPIWLDIRRSKPRLVPLSSVEP